MNELPYLHYLVVEGEGRQRRLVTVGEGPEGQAGTFVAPLQKDGRLFPYYCFDYSVYRDGQFESSGGKKLISMGLAISVAPQSGWREAVLLTFPSMGQSEPGGNGRNLPFPVLKRRLRRPALRYRGSLRSLRGMFAELQPVSVEDLDAWLETYGISIIGCAADSIVPAVRARQRNPVGVRVAREDLTQGSR